MEELGQGTGCRKWGTGKVTREWGWGTGGMRNGGRVRVNNQFFIMLNVVHGGESNKSNNISDHWLNSH